MKNISLKISNGLFRDFDNGYLENITSLGFTFNEVGGIENVPIRREHIDQKQ